MLTFQNEQCELYISEKVLLQSIFENLFKKNLRLIKYHENWYTYELIKVEQLVKLL